MTGEITPHLQTPHINTMGSSCKGQSVTIETVKESYSTAEARRYSGSPAVQREPGGTAGAQGSLVLLNYPVISLSWYLWSVGSPQCSSHSDSLTHWISWRGIHQIPECSEASAHFSCLFSSSTTWSYLLVTAEYWIPHSLGHLSQSQWQVMSSVDDEPMDRLAVRKLGGQLEER